MTRWSCAPHFVSRCRYTFELVDSSVPLPPVQQLGGMSQTPGEALVAADFRFCVQLTYMSAGSEDVLHVAAFAAGTAVTGVSGHIQVSVVFSTLHPTCALTG